MPYIKKEFNRREELQKGEPALNAGELNYQIFYYFKHTKPFHVGHYGVKKLVRQFLGKTPNYQRYNDMTGALIRCGKEIERRLNNSYALKLLTEVMESYDYEIAKYEDKKIAENGDVE